MKALDPTSLHQEKRKKQKKKKNSETKPKFVSDTPVTGPEPYKSPLGRTFAKYGLTLKRGLERPSHGSSHSGSGSNSGSKI